MSLIATRIRKSGNAYVVTIPREEMEARGLEPGQLVGIDPVPVEIRPAARPTVQEAIDAVTKENARGLHYLARR